MQYILLILCFLILTGIAILYMDLLELDLGEGMILAVLSVVLAMGGSVLISHSLFGGIVLIAALFAAAVFVIAMRYTMHARLLISVLISPYYIALMGILIISMLLYAGTLITNVEELRVWAYAAKYLLSYDELYISKVDLWNQGTVFFESFFLKIIGFRQDFLYVINGILCWIGLLLPFSGKEEEEPEKRVMAARRILIYVLLVYLAMYSVSTLGSKTCSPAQVLPCWAGGLAGWWITREKKKMNIVVLAAGLLCLGLFAPMKGIILIPLLLALIVVQTIYVEDFPYGEPRYVRLAAGLALACPFVYVIYKIFHSLKGMDLIVQETGWSTFIRAVAEDKLNEGISNLNYTFAFGLIMAIVIILVTGIFGGKKKESLIYSCYLLGASLLALGYVFGDYMSEADPTASYAISLMKSSLSMISMYTLVLSLCWLFISFKLADSRCYIGLGFGLILVFAYGMNATYLNRTTSLNPERTWEYAVVQKVRKQAESLYSDRSLQGSIYMLNQGSEVASAAAMFYLGNMVNDYTDSIWRFTTEGGMVFDTIDAYDSIDTLPDILTEGNYKYVWIYQSNEYLKKGLATVMGDEIEFSDDTKNANGTAAGAAAGANTTAAAGATTGANTNAAAGTAGANANVAAGTAGANANAAAGAAGANTNAAAGTAGANANAAAGTAGANASESIKYNPAKLTGVPSPGQLYEVLYENGKAVRLKHIKSVLPYENRQEYYRWNGITR